MIAASQLHRLAGHFVLFGALSLSVRPVEAQGSKAKPKKTTTVQVPKVDVTASEGTTATAMRGRPSNPGAVRNVNAALRTALTKPAVRGAVLAEVRRQLLTRRPLALVDGYWVHSIDLATVYQAPTIRTELAAALGPNGARLIAAAAGAREGAMIAFTPVQLGQVLMPNLGNDFGTSVASDALKANISGTGLEILTIMLLGWMAGEALGDFWSFLLDTIHEYNYNAKYGPSGDLDGDGIPNKDDKDRDGDGVPNADDKYPDDKSKSICDCTRPAVFFGAGTQSDILPGLIAVLGKARAQLSTGVSLGPVAPGQSGSVAVIF